MSFDSTYLLASDGTGNASLMHITSNRSAGSTTIAVDTLVGVPAKFIGTSGTVLPTGLIDPATVTNFYGQVSGSALQIDGFLPGNTDIGNTTGQIVVIKPNTDWANKVATLITNMYPIGSIYINAAVATNPATLLGIGTWVAFGTGEVMVGIDGGQAEFNTLGKTGGEKTHILLSGESGMPAHSHGAGSLKWLSGDGAPTATVVGGSGWGLNSAGFGINGPIGGSTANSSAPDAASAHNNLQPYITVYMWRRTA